jgi:PAS domain S-box-containing protein
LEFIIERGLVELPLDVQLVCDLQGNAPGIRYAAEKGIRTCWQLREVVGLPDLELIIELTGDDRTAAELQQLCPPGVRLVDHDMARIFWDLILVREKLEKEQNQTQRILDSIPDMIMVLDREMRIQTVNASFSRFTGLDLSQARGQLCHDVLCRRSAPPESSDITCPFRRVLETGKRVDLVGVSRYLNVTGIDEQFDITMIPLQKEGGEITQVVEALHPISERVRLIREVEVAAQRFSQFISSAHDLISIKDLDGRYQVSNEATAVLFGLRVEDLIGKTAHELYPPEIAAWISEHDQEVIQRGEAMSFEETLTLKDREVHLGTVRFPLRDYKGDVVGVCTISRDMTEEKRLQDQLVQADKLAAIGQLAAGVAHEINNPLTGILAYAEDLLAEAENDERAADYQVIVRETLRCREIVRNLLGFARQTKPRFQEAELNEVVGDTLALVDHLALFKDITLEHALAEDLPPVWGDKQQLEQVVLNLLMNSAESMNGRGVINISTSSLDRSRSCQIVVADNGPGIPEEELPQIFQPFASTKAAHQGLGLAVSWGIIEHHGGTIVAGNRQEGGTEFKVILPVLEEKK